MSKFLRGLGAGVADVSDTLLKDAIEKRRTEGILRLQQQLADQGYQRARADQIADRDEANTRQDKLLSDAEKRDDARLEKTLQGQKDVAKIGADSRLAAIEARVAAGGYGSQGAAKDDGKPKIVEREGPDGTKQRYVEGYDSGGNIVSVPYEKYEAMLRPPPPPPAASAEASAAPPAKSGLLNKAAAVEQPPPPIMRQGKVVQFAPPPPATPIYRNGKLVENR